MHKVDISDSDHNYITYGIITNLAKYIIQTADDENLTDEEAYFCIKDYANAIKDHAMTAMGHA